MKETQKKDITTQPAQAAGENKMGILPIRPLLLSMAWPAILSMTISALYNIVDSIFVAKLSEDALTAVSIVNPIQMLIIALSVGSGVGINSLIARRLGAHRQEEADQAASTGLRIGVFNYLVFLLIGVCFTGIFVSGYAEKGSEIYTQAVIYMQIVCIGSFFLNMQVVFEKILQSTGNMIAPMICSLTGAVINIILDPILIFGLLGAPRLEVAGAAIATITGQLFGMLVGAFIIFKGEHLVSIQVRGFKFNWEIVADIYKVGLPSIVMQSIGSMMIIFYNMILVVYSTTAVAVLGVYFKIQSFVFMPVFGLNQGAMPIMGYNYGAAKKDRLMQTYKEALTAAVSGSAEAAASDVRRVHGYARHRNSGSAHHQPLFPAGSLRHHHWNLIPGYRAWCIQPALLGHSPTHRYFAAGFYSDPHRWGDPILGILPACRTSRTCL